MLEEFRQNTRDGNSSKHEDEEDCALATKVKKGKGNKFHSNPILKARSRTCPR